MKLGCSVQCTEAGHIVRLSTQLVWIEFGFKSDLSFYLWSSKTKFLSETKCLSSIEKLVKIWPDARVSKNYKSDHLYQVVHCETGELTCGTAVNQLGALRAPWQGPGRRLEIWHKVWHIWASQNAIFLCLVFCKFYWAW